MTNILQKLQVRNRVEAALLARSVDELGAVNAGGSVDRSFCCLAAPVDPA